MAAVPHLRRGPIPLPPAARVVAAAGGVARAAELANAGIRRSDIDLALAYRRMVRIRHGLYALPDAHPDLVEAARLGGRLACMSALAYSGEMLELGGELHIEVPASASRIRASERVVVLHWRRFPRGGTRLVTSLEQAREDAARCRRRTARQAAP